MRLTASLMMIDWYKPTRTDTLD